jgi:signal transduction histidine kinase
MTRRGSLLRKVMVGNALLLVASVACCVWILDREHRESAAERTAAEARSIAESLRNRIAHVLAVDEMDPVELRLAGVADVLDDLRPVLDRGYRAAVVDAQGRVVAECGAANPVVPAAVPPGELPELFARGELVSPSAASGPAVRIALRLGPADAPLGAVVVAQTPTARTTGPSTSRRLWTFGAVAVLCLGGLAFLLARVWSLPLRRIVATARRLSRGDLTARVRLRGRDELGFLARALNEMRDHMATHVETIERQRRTLEALLLQLHEGVVAVGPDARIVVFNPAAHRLIHRDTRLDRDPDAWIGRTVEECVPHTELQRLLSVPRGASPGDREAASDHRVAATSVIAEGRVQLRGVSDAVSVLARAMDITLPGAPHTGGDGVPPATTHGRILVLTDITQLARTWQMKTDFVANASHELRTPLAVIRASVETLLSIDPPPPPAAEDLAGAGGSTPGGTSPPCPPAGRRTFLESIRRHTSRLEDLIEDLLALSRLEGSDAQRFPPGELSLDELFGELHARHREALGVGGLQWVTQRDPAALRTIRANPHLLTLVLDNLVSNAVRFTGSGGRVEVSCRMHGAAAELRVADTGCGIPAEEQTRIFERFYQVEPARSGDRTAAGLPRGTGLGLSIVRHAVATMNGRIELNSKVGRGTTVTVCIPQ